MYCTDTYQGHKTMDMAKCVRIETGYINQNPWGLQIYIKMGGDCVGIASGRKNNIHFVWGWRGAPYTSFCRVGSSPPKVMSSGELPIQTPRKVYPVGIVWGGFAWVSETVVLFQLIQKQKAGNFAVQNSQFRPNNQFDHGIKGGVAKEK